MRRLSLSVCKREDICDKIMFPGQAYCREVKKKGYDSLNRSIDPEQANAINRIIGLQGGAPYVIYGPPGTGKTCTLIEAIWQLYKSGRGKILVCAPSNAAADHILEKLVSTSCFFLKEHIFRLNSPKRKFNKIKLSLLEFCFYENKEFRCPLVKALKRYKIVISTNMSSSTLRDLPEDHFTHIFLDDAGQSSAHAFVWTRHSGCSSRRSHAIRACSFL
jgi:helicase MOV-10